MKKIVIAALLSATGFAAQAASLPEGLNWETNWDEPLIGSEEAKRGGTYRTFINSFPQTLRVVGPDSNSGLRAFFVDDVPALVGKHPDTLAYIPELANEWAFAGDDKTIYFKLNPKAEWSDGEKVTADDFLFSLKFYRSKDIVAPWYNTYYTEQISEIIKIDEQTLAIVSGVKKNKEDLLYALGGFAPRPEHFYKPSKDENGDGVDDNFVRKYNFKPEPTTNAYYLDKVKKGKSVTFKHVGDDWWGYSNRYYQNRFNVDKIRMKVIRDNDIARKHFEKGSLDAFFTVLPEVWHEKTDTEPYQKGYIHRFWGFNEVPQGMSGLWLNTSKPNLSDQNIRKGIMHASDYDGMIKKLIRGDYSRMPTAAGFGHGKYSLPNPVPPKFDPVLAGEYFAKAGYDRFGPDGIRINEKGERLSFAITYGWNTHTPRIAYLKEQAKKAGIDFSLNLVDGSSAFKYIREKKHQIAWLTMGTNDVPQYWGYFHSANANKAQTNNHTNYSTPDLDSLIEQYRNEFDVVAKQKLSQNIQQAIADADVVVPGYMVPYTREAYWRYMKYPEQPMTKRTESLFTISSRIGLHTFWIDEEEKKATKKAVKSGKTFEPVTVMDTRYKL